MILKKLIDTKLFMRKGLFSLFSHIIVIIHSKQGRRSFFARGSKILKTAFLFLLKSKFWQLCGNSKFWLIDRICNLRRTDRYLGKVLFCSSVILVCDQFFGQYQPFLINPELKTLILKVCCFFLKPLS